VHKSHGRFFKGKQQLKAPAKGIDEAALTDAEVDAALTAEPADFSK
jgi:hypothetical protein